MVAQVYMYKLVYGAIFAHEGSNYGQSDTENASRESGLGTALRGFVPVGSVALGDMFSPPMWEEITWQQSLSHQQWVQGARTGWRVARVLPLLMCPTP